MRKVLSMRIKEGTPIMVRWFDANRRADEYGPKETFEPAPMEMEDIGMYVKTEDGYITIVEEREFGTCEYRHVHHIPIVNIIDIWQLQKEKIVWQRKTTRRAQPRQKPRKTTKAPSLPSETEPTMERETATEETSNEQGTRTNG